MSNLNRNYPVLVLGGYLCALWIARDFGNTTLCVSISISTLSLENKKISSFLKNIKYNGLGSAEFKKDPKDGQLKLLEINARPWIHSWFSKRCGIDILFSSYLDAIGEKADLNQKYVIGIKSIHLQNDLEASMHLINEASMCRNQCALVRK